MQRLLDALIDYFDDNATLDTVRAAARDACRAMRENGVEPQAMLGAFRAVLRTAAERAHIPVSTHALAAVRTQLSPWMVDQCFERRSASPRHDRVTRITLQ